MRFDPRIAAGRRALRTLDIQVIITADSDEDAIAIARDLKGKLDSDAISQELQKKGLDMSAKLSDSMSQPVITDQKGNEVPYNAGGDMPIGFILGIVVLASLMVGGLVIAYMLWRREQAKNGGGHEAQGAEAKAGGEWGCVSCPCCHASGG